MIETPNHNIGGTTIAINIKIMAVRSGSEKIIKGATIKPGKSDNIFPILNSRADIRALFADMTVVCAGISIWELMFMSVNDPAVSPAKFGYNVISL